MSSIFNHKDGSITLQCFFCPVQTIKFYSLDEKEKCVRDQVCMKAIMHACLWLKCTYIQRICKLPCPGLTFLLRSLTVILTVLLLFLLTLVFVLQWLSIHWEILIMLLSQFSLVFFKPKMGCPVSLHSL